MDLYGEKDGGIGKEEEDRKVNAKKRAFDFVFGRKREIRSSLDFLFFFLSLSLP
jgi:hypothetical protein